MNDPQLSATGSSDKDDIYLKIWEIEQKHTATRWTVAIFFLNVSFVVFGLSFDPKQVQPQRHVLQIAALVIYWFAVFLLERFSMFTDVLRTYLYKMESEKQTTLDIQHESNKVMGVRLNVRLFMKLFGIAYIIAVLVLWYGFGI